MSIYRISKNIEEYMFFVIDDLDIYEKMESFDIDGFGRPLAFKWVAPNAEFLPSDSGSNIIPDVTQWGGADLIINAKAKQVLANCLSSLGDILPLAGACGRGWMFNPTKRFGNEIIDPDNTKSIYFDDGSWERLDKLSFIASVEKLVPCIFTIDIDRGANLYCSDEFKNIVEKNRLKGLFFELISP